MPLSRTAVPAGLAALLAGFLIGIPGFFSYAARAASANNEWMLRTVGRVGRADAQYVSTGTTALSLLTLFEFLFLTPIGLVSVYLVTTGLLRAVSASVDDPRGDPILSGAHWAIASLAATARRRWLQRLRESREGHEVPDVLTTGDWAGLPVDYIVIASRRKPEWEAGAIIMTSTDWYRLGAPLDTEVNGGLRTLYPLTKLEAVEVVRRGIHYELPRLSRRSARDAS